NRLWRVSDKGDACTSTGATDFNDGATISLEYTYDACGARTSDANKGIAGIQYSYWGTPELIQFTNGSQTRYVYDANGMKLKRIHITAVDNIVVPLKTVMELSDDQILTSDTTEYCGNLVFENGRLDKVLFSSGYVSCNDNAANRFTFHYFVKDHLGNNRVVVNESGAIEQTTHYYPFGNSFADAGTSPSLQHYKYNGKELDRMHGLDWYDYGARNYDPVILQWDRMDQLCEKYHNVSPYVYCHANPINMIDPDGNDDYYTNSGRFLYSDDKATDFIIIRNESLYIQKQLTGAAWINPYTPLANISLSSEAYSKIFTDVLSKMDNVNVTDLHNGKVSVTVWQDDGNMRSTTDQYNDAGLTGGVLAGIGSYNGKQRLTAYVDIFGAAEQKIYSSRSNIQNLLGVHEYIEHFKNDIGNDDNSHLKIYKNMQKHSS
ncbi:MAG: RHS repeat-associated core domain-containing protein, partial [Prevotella sp.]|nr:RHS repeat-associated core domain-containing protein [Prevotella sp.]